MNTALRTVLSLFSFCVIFLPVRGLAQCPATPQLYGTTNLCSTHTSLTLRVNNAAGTQQYTSNGGSSWTTYTGSTISAGGSGTYRVRNIANGCTTQSNSLTMGANATTVPNMVTDQAYSDVKPAPAGDPWAIAVSSKGAVAICTGSGLYLYPDLSLTNPIVLPLGSTRGVAFSPDGSRLLVAENGSHRVLVYNSIPTSSSAQPSLAIGQTNLTNTTAGTGANQLNGPRGVLVLPDGRLYITDYGNNRVLIYNRIPTASGATADAILGGTEGVTESRFSGPYGMRFGVDGRFYLTDASNSRILVYNSYPVSGSVANSVIGQPNLTTNGISTDPGRFYTPFNMDASWTGRLAIADPNGPRVTIYHAPPSSGITLPDASLTGSFTTGSVTKVAFPSGAATLPDGRLLVGDNTAGKLNIYGNLPCAQANLNLTVSASNAGMTCTYNNIITYTVNNPSSTAVGKVVVMAALPYNAITTGVTASTGAYAAGSGIWQISSIPAGGSATLELSGNFSALGSQGTVNIQGGIWGGEYSDPDMTDNSASLSIIISSSAIATPTLTATNTVICNGSSRTLTVGNLATTRQMTSNGGSSWSNLGSVSSVSVFNPGTYQIRNISGSCTVTSAAVTMTRIDPPAAPVLTANGPTTFCASGSATISVANRATTSEYTTNGGTSWQTLNSNTITTTATGTVQVRNIASVCTTTSNSISTIRQATVPPPTITAGGPTTICPNGSVTLTASSGSDYIWSNGATTQSITVSAAGSYTVRAISQSTGCTSTVSAAQAVSHLPQPVVTLTPALAICQGQSTTLTAGGGTTYQWTDGPATASYSVSPTSTTTYSVRVGNDEGCFKDTSVTVTVNPALAISASGPTRLTEGESVTLTANGPGPWTWNTGATTADITVSTGGIYYVTRTGCDMASVAVTVLAKPSLLLSPSGASRTLCVGQTGTIAANVASASVSTVAGTFLASGDLTGAATTTARFRNLSSVTPAPDGTWIIVDPINQKIKRFDPATNQVSLLAGSTQGFANNDDPAQAQFNNPLFTVFDSKGNLFVVDELNQRVRRIDPQGKVSTFAGSGTAGGVNGPGDVATFSAPVGIDIDSADNLYIIQRSGGVRKITPAGIVSTLGTTSTGCFGIAVERKASPRYIYVTQATRVMRYDMQSLAWTTYAGSASAGTANGHRTAASFSSLRGLSLGPDGRLYLADYGGHAIRVINTLTDTVSTLLGGSSGNVNGSLSATRVNGPHDVEVDAAGNLAIAEWGGLILRKVVMAPTRSWSTGASSQTISVNSAGTYTVTASSLWGASTTASQTISYVPLPTLVASDTVVCEGESITLTASGGYSYQWTNGPATASWTFAPSATNTYTVNVNANGGCVYRKSVTVVVNPLFVPTFNLSAGDGCQGSPLTITNAASCVGCTWLWNTGGTSSSVTLSPGLNNYSLRVITAAGCTTETAPLAITGRPTGWWLGSSADWDAAANWCGGVPSSTSSIHIDSLVPSMPVINSTANVLNVHVAGGATLTLAPSVTLVMNGNQTGTGAIVGSCSSTLLVNGSSRQVVGPASLGTLMVANSNNVEMKGDLDLCSGISFMTGKVFTNSHLITLTGTYSSPSETANNHIVGRIRARGRAAGTGALTMLGVQLAAGPDDLDTVYIERISEPASFEGNQSVATMWKIRTHNPPVSGRDVTFSWLASRTNGNDMSSVQVWRRPEGDSAWLRVGAATQPQLNFGFYRTTVNTTAFSDWTVSSNDNPLPVTLVQFSGRRNGSWVNLSWLTRQERMNRGFVVERSLDGQRFDSLGFVAGQGTSSGQHRYGFEDQQPAAAYYRLTQLDDDGTRSPSPIVFVGRGEGPALSLHPNPARRQVLVSGLEGAAQLVIRNSLGQTVLLQQVDASMLVDLADLPAGVYSCQIGEQIIRLVKE